MFHTLNNIWLFFNLLAYMSVFISPLKFWGFGFLTFTIPVFVLGNIIWIIYWTIRQRHEAWLNVLILILGFNHIYSTVQFSIWQEKNKTEINTFKVLSYNVKAFNLYHELSKKKNEEPSKAIVHWIKQNDAEIQCFQEFYHNNNNPTFNTLENLRKNKHCFFYTPRENLQKGTFGMAIFSVYPILNKGIVEMKTMSYNACMFADLKIGNDTVRVYNVHLQSMNIDENEVVKLDKFKNKYLKLFRKLKHGFGERAEQIEFLLNAIEDSPVKRIILCGDFNELQYSYVYHKTKQKLKNSFEAKGWGFGFSYNGALPFLRIDHQFFSEGLQIYTFKTLQGVRYSDHFPIEGVYSME